MSEPQRPELESPIPAEVSTLLTRPAFVIAVVVLLLNDHVFKSAFGGWWTGKLSDFAGLFAFPLLWCAIWPRRRKPIFAATAVGFFFWKSPLSETFLTAWNGFGVWRVSRVVDYSDLVAVVALVPAYWLLETRVTGSAPKRSSAVRKMGAVATALVALVAFTATTVPPKLYVIPMREGYDVPGNRSVIQARLDTLGTYPSTGMRPLWRRRREGSADTVNILGGRYRMLIEVRDAGADSSVVTLLKGGTYGNVDNDEEVRRAFRTVVVALRALPRRSASDVGYLAPIGTREETIARFWAAYLDSKHGRVAANATTRSAFWNRTEQDSWPMYDLAGYYVPDNAVPRVTAIRKASGGEFEIVTRFLPAGSSPMDSTVAPSITTTVYAVRESDHWTLASALPRKTARWQQETVGQITYHIEPGLTFNRIRADRAVAFVDSLSAALGLPRAAPMDYYVTSSVEVAFGIQGVELPTKAPPGGGFAKDRNRQLISADPVLAENYRHELTHMVIHPLLGSTTFFASEGVPTWLGGTEGNDFRGSVRTLARYLTEHPQVELDSLMESMLAPQAVRYAGGAVLAEMVYRAGGAAAIKEFLTAGPSTSALRERLTRLLRRSWSEVAADWQKTTFALATPSS